MTSQRFRDSGGAFGLYDDFLTGSMTIDVPIIGTVGVTTSINSGLHNTLIAEFSTGAATVEAYYGPNGRAFDTNVSLDAALTVGIPGYVFDAASIEISGNGFAATIGSQDYYFPADNLSLLTAILIENNVDPGAAGLITSAMEGIIDALAALEDEVKDLLELPDGSGIVFIDNVPGEVNHDGNWEPFYPIPVSYTLNDEGDRLGTDQANDYHHSQSDGNIIIYDYSEDNNTQDGLFLDDVTADEVVFSQNDDRDLVITTSGGATVTINNHFLQTSGSSYHAIELVTFSDGTVLTADEIADLITAGQNIIGTSGDDTLTDTSGSDTIAASYGDDTIVYTSGDDVILGDSSHINGGNDTLDLSQYTADQVSFRIVGVDVFIDTPDGTIELDHQVRYDVGHSRTNIENIVFSDGTLDDAGIRVRAIADQTSAGDDTVTGSYLGDVISSGAGNDTIAASYGDDTIVYTSGDDVILGDSRHINGGNDTLDLSQYTADQVTFRIVGADVFVDTPDGSIELDHQVRYDIGHSRSNIENIIFSDGTLDEAGIRARSINDQATDGNDVVIGSYQNDVVSGGAGNDTLTGSGGSDTFVFASGDGNDLITDYNTANDALEFIGISFTDLTITQSGSDVLIEYGTGDQVIVQNTLTSDFQEPEFLFV